MNADVRTRAPRIVRLSSWIVLLLAASTVPCWGQEFRARPGYLHGAPPSTYPPPPDMNVRGPSLNPNDTASPDSAGLPDDGSGDIRPLTETLSLNVAPRGMSLRDAIQFSLNKSDIVRTLGSGGVQIESVTGYDPAIMRARSNVAATTFDPKLTTGYVGSRINEPTGTFFGPGIPQNTRRDEGDFTASISKSWATGGTTSIGYLPPLGYLFYPFGTSGLYNPTYTSDLVVTATQPLLRGAGWAVNLAPIRIAQLRAEQSAWDCKLATMAQVRSVENAYWDLQAALVAVDAFEFVIPLMSEIVRIERIRSQSELSVRADVARASMQFDSLQQQRIQSRNDAVSKELRLRNLIAIDLTDGTRLLPVDLPRRAPVPLDHAAAMANALENRPDIVRQRLGVRIREFEYAVARNGVRPQLDLQALYRSNGIGQDLSTSLNQMAGFNYTDWTLGATFSIPLGNRAAKANLNAAELQLVRDRAVLNQTIQNLSFSLADLIRESGTAFSQFELALRRVENSREWIRAARIRYSNPPPSEDGNQNWLLLAMYDYQNALKMHVDAITDAATLLARYNTQLARLEEAQGILLENRGVELSDDPCVAVQRNSGRLFGNSPQNSMLANGHPTGDPTWDQGPPSSAAQTGTQPVTDSGVPVTQISGQPDGGHALPRPGHSTGMWRGFAGRTIRPTNFSTFPTPPPNSVAPR